MVAEEEMVVAGEMVLAGAASRFSCDYILQYIFLLQLGNSSDILIHISPNRAGFESREWSSSCSSDHFLQWGCE